ncbi:MAG TPA: FapA family protein [Phycisphaerae bacterium]|nr:FapA family protein [Phycisphaerae bacterium]
MTTTAVGVETGKPELVSPTHYLCVVFPSGSEGAEAGIPWSRRIVWPCREGEVIARVLPREQAPLDSQGELAIPLEAVRLGKHADWNEDRTEVVAKKTGHINLRKDLLEVEDVWTLNEDLDASSGPIELACEAHLNKNVLDLVHLDSEAAITVHGSVEAATIRSRTNITIHHGVCGKERGLVAAEGNVSVRFASNAKIRAGGNIEIGKDVTNSDLFCRGMIAAERASLLSGRIAAISKISCETAGSESAVKVLLELSLSPEEIERIEPVLGELKALRQKSEQIRAAIEPLMKDTKRLTNQQKEKATELLCTAAEFEKKSEELHKSLDAARKELDRVMNGVVEIRGRVYPEVTVSIGGVHTTFKKEMTGPMKIVLRDEHHMPTLVALDAHNRPTSLHTTTTPLHSLLHTLRTGAPG